MLTTIKSGLMTDPFSFDGEENDDGTLPLISILRECCILHLSELGEAQVKKFGEQRLKTRKAVSWNATPNLKIHTFDALTRTKVIKTADNKTITVAPDRGLFGRLVISAKSRDINLKEVFRPQ